MAAGALEALLGRSSNVNSSVCAMYTLIATSPQLGQRRANTSALSYYVHILCGNRLSYVIPSRLCRNFSHLPTASVSHSVKVALTAVSLNCAFARACGWYMASILLFTANSLVLLFDCITKWAISGLIRLRSKRGVILGDSSPCVAIGVIDCCDCDFRFIIIPLIFA